MRLFLRRRTVFEYLIDKNGLESRIWSTEDQLRISLSSVLVAEIKGNYCPILEMRINRLLTKDVTASSLSRVIHKALYSHPSNLFDNDKHGHASRASGSPSNPADPALEKLTTPKRGQSDSHTEVSSDTYHSANTNDRHDACNTSDEEPRPAKRQR